MYVAVQYVARVLHFSASSFTVNVEIFVQQKFSSFSWTGFKHEVKFLTRRFQTPMYYCLDTRQAREHGVVEIFSKDQQTRRNCESSVVLAPCC